MRKFKHKQSGQIVTENKEGLFVSQHGGYKLQKWIFENSNDWEEVIEEPNYLITSFRSIEKSGKFKNTIITLDKDGTFQGGFRLNNFLYGQNSVEDGCWEIYSVKNSKGEEFTIGDNVFYLPKRSIELFKIHNFFINRDGILLARSSEESSATCEDINTISKEIKVPYTPKQPIYTTTDGFDIYEGCPVILYIYVNSEHENIVTINHFTKEDAIVAKRRKCFISEENRDKYIKENTPKPFFKTEDGVDIYEGAVIYIVSLEEQLIFPETFYFNKTMTGNAIFFDEKMALKYLNENTKKKPIFTSEDGKDMYDGDKYYVPQIQGINRELSGSYCEFIVRDYCKGGNTNFSTKELAQEYIDNNKPKYSLADIEKAYCKAMNSEFDGLGEIIEELKKLGK